MYLNLYALPAVIACILSSLIGIYVFYKNPKNIQNRVFVLFIFFVVVFSIAEIMLRFSSNSEEGLFWGRIGYIGVIFVPITFLHLSFVFPRERSMVKINKYLLFVMYLIGIVTLCAFDLIVSIQDVQLSIWGYRLALNSSTIGILIVVTLFFAIFNLVRSYQISRSLIEKKQIKYVFYGGLVGAMSTIGTNILPPMVGIEIFPLATVTLSIFTIFIGAAILKYNLFRFKLMVEPALEEKKAGPKIYELKLGKSYLVKEERGEQGYKIFIDQITHDISGLCVTKYPPNKIRDKYGFEKTPLFWFTFKKSNEETTVNPKKIDVELILQIEDFVKKGKQTIVYMDCFDQVSLVKGFENTLTLISDIKNICRENHSILLLSVNPKMFEEKQISTLEKEFLEVK